MMIKDDDHTYESNYNDNSDDNDVGPRYNYNTIKTDQ
jgi:hypothetical protein